MVYIDIDLDAEKREGRSGTAVSNIEKELEKQGNLWYYFKGNSMYPMLREGTDLIHIVPVKGELKKYDVPVYRRADGVYVVHRIIRRHDGVYDIRGDNTYRIERGIKRDDIIGVVDAFTRGEKTVKVTDPMYRIYVQLNTAAYPVRWIYKRLLTAAGSLMRTGGKNIRGKRNEN